MVKYVCRCGGTNRFCTTCWGERYYTPKGTKKKKAAPASIPTQRTGPPEELGTPVANAEETEPTDA